MPEFRPVRLGRGRLARYILDWGVCIAQTRMQVLFKPDQAQRSRFHTSLHECTGAHTHKDTGKHLHRLSCAHTHTHGQKHTQTQTQTQTNTDRHRHTHTLTHTHTHAHMHTHSHTHAHAHEHVQTNKYTNTVVVLGHGCFRTYFSGSVIDLETFR